MFHNGFKLKGRKSGTRKVNYASFKNGLNTDYDKNLTPVTISKNTYNFNYKNGNLKTGLGISVLKLPISSKTPEQLRTLNTPDGTDALKFCVYEVYSQANKVWYYFLVLYCSDKKLYYTDVYLNYEKFFEYNQLQDVPNFINYKLNGNDALIITSEKDGMKVWEWPSSIYEVSEAPSITSMCLHYERLFATTNGEKSEVWFSEDLDPTNWNVSLSEGGFIQMYDERGRVNKVISFKDHVYVIRDYGIARITAYAVQTEFDVSQLFVSSGRIYENTVCVCGDKVMFLASNGVYAFDGISTVKLNLGVETLFDGISNQSSVACYFNNKYYLACRVKFPDLGEVGYEGGKNNVLLEIDTRTGELNILRGCDINYMYALKTNNLQVLVVSAYHNGRYILGMVDSSGSVFGTPTKKMWETPPTDFGRPQSIKAVSEIYVNNKHPFTLTITTEQETKQFAVPAGNEVSVIKPYIKGRVFTLNFSTEEAEAEISNPQIIFSTL